MIGFENYSLQDWLVETLTRHPRTRSTSLTARRERRSHSWQTRFLAPAIAVGAVSLITDATVFAAGPGADSTVMAHSQGAAVHGGSAVYWTGAIAEIQGWQRAEEADVPRPPPIF